MGELLVTWAQIAKYCGVSVRTIQRRRGELVAEGVVFWRRKRLGKRFVCAWPDDLREFMKK